MAAMDQEVHGYIERTAPEHRPLLDRLHQLILAAHPDASAVLSHRIPTHKVGDRRPHVGAWKHTLSIYSWQHGRRRLRLPPLTQHEHGALLFGPDDGPQSPTNSATLSASRTRCLTWRRGSSHRKPFRFQDQPGRRVTTGRLAARAETGRPAAVR